MFSTRHLLLLVVAALTAACAPTTTTAHPLPVPHVDQPQQVINGQTLGLSVGFAPARATMRHLRAEHNGEDHTGGLLSGGAATQGNVISPGGGDVNPNTGVKNPGGILGPLYAAFPGLLAPLAMASDTVHNSNAAVSGVQHTPDGIFQA